MQLTCTCKYKKGNILHYYTCTQLENGGKWRGKANLLAVHFKSNKY